MKTLKLTLTYWFAFFVLAQLGAQTTVNKAIQAQLAGDYTIGSSGNADFATLKTAIDALNEGVNGSVTFHIEAGTYNENVLIKGISGASAVNTITFTSQSGKNDDVIIAGVHYVDPGYGGVKYGMFCVDSTSYVTVENLSFTPTDQNFPYNVHIRNQSRHFTLRNCRLTANLITSGYSGTNQFYMEAMNVEGKNNDYVTIEGNTITGGYIGLYTGGTSYVALTKEVGAIIRNNRLVNQASKGIYMFDERNALIENNIISSSTTQKTDYQGIDMFRCKDQTVIRNNKISNSQAYYSKGIYLRTEVAGTIDNPVLVYNNAISITNSPSSTTYGIALTDNCSNIQFYHNTVYIGGSAGCALGVTGSTETIKNMVFKNNLLQSKTATYIYFFNKESHFKAFSFSNNAYLLTGTSFTNKWGADFATWTTNSSEANSLLDSAKFVSETDLHLTAAGHLNAGTAIAFIGQDADGKVRNVSIPTIGAYEYEDMVAITPQMDDAYPKVKNITYKSADVVTKYNQSGKLYYIVQPASDVAPTADQLLLSTPTSINKDEEFTISLSNLNQQTTYKLYCLEVSALSKTSAITASEEFSTPKQILPLAITLPKEWGRIDEGNQVSLHATVTGGVYPYHFTWKNDMQQTVGTDSILSVAPSQLAHYTLTVKDFAGKDSTVNTVVYVNSTAGIADFENLYLAPESYWEGPEGNTDTNTESKFYSGTYSFSNTYYPDWNYWGGYAYSNVTATDYNPAEFSTQQFRSVVGHGADNSSNYAVVYAMGARTDIAVTHNVNGDIIQGVYLTNTACTYNSMINGDSFVGAPFTQDDWYKIIVKGTKADGTTTTKEIYLADYRDSDPANHYILTNWKWFDLSSLGTVTKISITVDGSRKNEYGLTIPSYFCMDNLGAADAASGHSMISNTTLKVYPNPFSDYIIIQSDKIQSLKLFAISGQLLKDEMLSEGENRIDTHLLSKGTYIIKCGNESIKLIK